jgi:predicted nuclease of restriction endonuclease-like RecB superfamily
MAAWVLERLCERKCPSGPVPSREVRARVFGEAQRRRSTVAFERERVLVDVGGELGLAPGAVAEQLYADIPAEQRIVAPTPLPDARDLALRTNQAIVQGLLRSASAVQIELGSSSRPVVRQLQLKRLLCTVRPSKAGICIEISGPYSLFRHTTLYGRALASILAVLRGADRFVLVARCERKGQMLPVRVSSGDPVFPPSEDPRRYDSALEERFAKDFAKVAPDWDVVREPEAVPVDGTFVFPDFALVHRRDPRRRWLLEVVGFWTPEYLKLKLARLERARRRDLIICIDEALGCGADAFPPSVIPFRRKVDAAAVARRIEGNAP